MKKLMALFIVVIAMLSVSTSGEYAQAISMPYVVIGEDIWLLDNESGSRIFLLPKTYYAKIDGMDDNFYYVTFNGVGGKIPKASVSVVGYEKEVKDTSKTLHILSSYSVFTEIKLKAKMEGESVDNATIPTNEAFVFLGTYKQGETLWYYVTYGGSYGYIEAAYTDDSQIQISDFVPEVEAEPIKNAEEEKSKDEQPELVKILVISGVSVVAIIFVLILFIPRKGKKHKYYYS